MTNWLDPELLAQEVHGAIGFGFLLAVYYRIRPYAAVYFDLAIGVFLLVVFLKELLWDPVHETDNPFVWQGVEDWCFYMIGIALGALFVLA
jgi:hypothetical protein